MSASKEYRYKIADELEKIAKHIRENEIDFIENVTHSGYYNNSNGSHSIQTSIEGFDYKACKFSLFLPVDDRGL